MVDSEEQKEKAIAAYLQALTIYTREQFPERWAAVQNNLGITYSNRISGSRQENIENAIFRYHEALTVYTKEAFPIQWAEVMNNLGVVLSNRVRGDRAQNLEQAIAAYKASLSIITREYNPLGWANTMVNLATFYANSDSDPQELYLQQAINLYESALTIIRQSDYPEKWAEIQRALGAVLNKFSEINIKTGSDSSTSVEATYFSEKAQNGEILLIGQDLRLGRIEKALQGINEQGNKQFRVSIWISLLTTLLGVIFGWLTSQIPNVFFSSLGR